MKTKLVLWGEDKDDKKVLVALELVESENKVKTYVFDELHATEIFYNQMVNEWRVGHEVPFPDHRVFEKELSLSDSILPDEIKVERTDLVNRAKTEWHFVILSAKLHEMYQNELNELKEQAEKLTSFDSKLWQEMKEFWDKVQAQVFEKNLFREHANDLKKQTNAIFETLKKHRKAFDEEFKTQSKTFAAEFLEEINTMADKIEKGLGLQPIFEELKALQRKFKQVKFTREDRNKVWNNLDAAFKKVKEKRYGDVKGDQKSPLSRLENRYKGLMDAISKMEKSISRDEREMEFQNKRKEGSEGQLEMQIREAKAQMILSRVNSKKEKLGDMLKTKAELERRMEVEKQKETARKHKEEVKEKEQELKERVKEEIREKEKEMEADAEKLEKAAEVLQGKESLGDAISEAVTEAVEDASATVKAVAKVLKDNVKKALDNPDEEE